MTGIYKITSPSGKVYIGQSRNIEKRFNCYRKHPSNEQRNIYYSLLKYGADNHLYNVIHELPEDIVQNNMNEYEQFYMDRYRDCAIVLLNIKEAGSIGRHSEETKRRIGISNSGKNPSAETRAKISVAGKGRKHSLDHNRKVGASHKGKTVSDESKKRMSIAHLGKIISAETREKMSIIRKGKRRPY